MLEAAKPALPKDFPPFTTVQRYFYAWRDGGLWQIINHVLPMDVCFMKSLHQTCSALTAEKARAAGAHLL